MNRLALFQDNRPWIALTVLLSVLVMIPMFLLFIQWGHTGVGEQGIWHHLLETKLFRLIGNTVVLVAGVGAGVSLLGISLAWLTASCDFPGRRFFDWALMLPLAVPSYVMAFVFLATFNYAGPVQTAFRQWFGTDVYFPDIQAAPFVILVFSLVLYPYVYMLARSAFLNQGKSLMEAARILGLSPMKAFCRSALPVARPAIAAGVALALMETLADFGAVSVFNYDTFTTAIYNAWLGMYSIEVAAQLATLLLLFVFIALMLEQKGRAGARYSQDQRRGKSRRYDLKGRRGILAMCWCGLVLAIAFVLPVSQLLLWSLDAGISFNSRYQGFLLHTVGLGAIAAVLTTVFALVLAFSRQLPGSKSGKRVLGVLVRISTLGYALPGSVLAVGTILMFAPLQAWLGQTLMLSLVGLILAYIIRYLAVAFAPVESGLENIRPSMLEAARSLGSRPGALLTRISIPMMRTGLLTALVVVFVDVMKEMPATLILRPFGWDTLAVRIYEMTTEGQWEMAALPAITLILVGLVPVVLIVRHSRQVQGRNDR